MESKHGKPDISAELELAMKNYLATEAELEPQSPKKSQSPRVPKSPIEAELEAGKEDVEASSSKTVHDDIDVMVDQLHLGS